MPSSTSIPSSPLPFAADIHSHNSWRLSHPRPTNPQQSYASFLADAHTQNAAGDRINTTSRIKTPSIPPSSVSSLPGSHRRLLRRHYRLFYGLLGGFYLASILLTVAIVLIVRDATLGSVKDLSTGAVIVGVIGFAGMLACLAGGWGVWKARKDRARMEEEWADEENTKVERHEREKTREIEKLEAIKQRERRLSTERSVSRGRRREERDNFRKSTSSKKLRSDEFPAEASRSRPENQSKSRSTKRAELEGYSTQEAQENEILPASFLPPRSPSLPLPSLTRNNVNLPPRTSSLKHHRTGNQHRSPTKSRNSGHWTHHLDLGSSSDDSKTNKPRFIASTKRSVKPHHHNSNNIEEPESSAPKTQAVPRSHPRPHANPSSTLTPTSPFPAPSPLPYTQPRSASSTPSSDTNFLAMMARNEGGAPSEDEDLGRLRRERSVERVREWRLAGGDDSGKRGRRMGRVGRME